MARTGALPHRLADLGSQVVIEGHITSGDHEQHDTSVAAHGLTNRDGLDNAGHRFGTPVNLCGTDADTSRVQGGIGSPVNDETASGRLGCEVAVVPRPVKAIEISVEEATAVGIVPKSDRYRRKWCSAHELASSADNGQTFLVKDGHVHP